MFSAACLELEDHEGFAPLVLWRRDLGEHVAVRPVVTVMKTVSGGK